MRTLVGEQMPTFSVFVEELPIQIVELLLQKDMTKQGCSPSSSSNIFGLSNRLVKQAYNIVLSQTLPIFYTINSTKRAFLEIQSMIDAFVENGFLTSRLYRMILKFCTTKFFPDIGFNIEDFGTLLQNYAFRKGKPSRISF